MNRTFVFIIFVSIATAFISGCGSGTRNGNEKVNDLPVDRLTELKMRAEAEPENAMVYNDLALYYLGQENFSEALHNINRSLELEPTNTAHFVTLSDIYLMMGDAQRAQATLHKALDMEPGNASIHAHLGRLQVFMEDYPRAFENLRKALEIDNAHSHAYFWRGVAWLENEDTAKAITDWQLAVANDPESFDGYFQLGLLMAERQNSYAYDYLDHALRLAPQDADVLYDIGIAFQEIDRSNRAIETYERILDIDTCYYQAWFNIGYLHLVERAEYETAIEYFSKALACNPGYVDAVYNRGLAYEVLENPNSARRDYRQALTLQVNYQKAIEGLNRLDEAVSQAE
jgi:tetratricopeptide (TPR) repeat protein